MASGSVLHFKSHMVFDTVPYVEKISSAKKSWESEFGPGSADWLPEKMYWRCSLQWIQEFWNTAVNDGPMSDEEIAAMPAAISESKDHMTFCGLRVCMDALLKGSVCELALDAWQ